MNPVRPGPSARRRLPRAASIPAQLGLLAVLALAFAVSSRAAVTAPADSTKAKGPAGSVDVMISGQGVPIPGVKVTVAPDKGGPPETWNAGDSVPIGMIVSGANGHAVFDGVPPGKYVVTTNCLIPGNWIAGNFATKVEVLPGRPAHVTLTGRRGGMIKGKVVGADLRGHHMEIHADSPDALQSVCPTMTASAVDTLTGEFTISKMPVDATTWVKAYLDFGPGQLSVWKDVHFDKPETLSTAITFPALGESEVGSLLLELKADGADPPDSGSAHLMQIKADGSWRYEATIGVGGSRGGKTVPGLPSGLYQMRANAEPGSQKWWGAAIDTLRILPGKVTRYTITARTRSS